MRLIWSCEAADRTRRVSSNGIGSVNSIGWATRNNLQIALISPCGARRGEKVVRIGNSSAVGYVKLHRILLFGVGNLDQVLLAGDSSGVFTLAHPGGSSNSHDNGDNRQHNGYFDQGDPAF